MGETISLNYSSWPVKKLNLRAGIEKLLALTARINDTGTSLIPDETGFFDELGEVIRFSPDARQSIFRLIDLGASFSYHFKSVLGATHSVFVIQQPNYSHLRWSFPEKWCLSLFDQEESILREAIISIGQATNSTHCIIDLFAAVNGDFLTFQQPRMKLNLSPERNLTGIIGMVDFQNIIEIDQSAIELKIPPPGHSKIHLIELMDSTILSILKENGPG
ncbi:unnamed protein product [Tuwongella immobilis]|uniref:Uncharacterized protein n=2 Tax=Tuwongella immobilis TaxID=692036 RepID=A0A6C2YKT8_9BACT|nr:unnamed protein product [Tuwongella immobilis]VTS00225.1 unnamed protein product [Tuwongella immobilis]